MDRESGTLRLDDGRMLGFARYGAPDGAPVLYCTGGNSSRLEGRWFDRAARRDGIDLIVPDRPGFGLSDFQPGRRFVDWPDDVARLADVLHVDRFAVFGLSGGSPHVAALAWKLAGRVTGAAIVSGLAPPEMPGWLSGTWPPVRGLFFLARRAPWLSALALRRMAAFYADEARMLKRMKQALPEPDVRLFEARPEIPQVFSASAREAHRSGVRGDAWEWQLYVRPWGFRLQDVSTEVALWYGRHDRNTPLAMGQYLANVLPNSSLRVVDDGGHFSTINNHIAGILAHLRSADPR